MPRRRRGAAALEPEAERGLAMRMLLRNPKDMVAGALAFAAVSAILANALLLQAGRHPSPMFGSVVASPSTGLLSPLPRPRPAEAAIKPADMPPSEFKPAEPKPVDAKPAEKATDPLTSLVKATTAPAPAPAAAVPALAPSNVPRPPAPIPAASRSDTPANSASSSRRVAAVQRALTEYGYGQLKPTGTVGSDTQAAIGKFERARKIPVTGQVSDRLVRELVAIIGHPID